MTETSTSNIKTQTMSKKYHQKAYTAEEKRKAIQMYEEKIHYSARYSSGYTFPDQDAGVMMFGLFGALFTDSGWFICRWWMGVQVGLQSTALPWMKLISFDLSDMSLSVIIYWYMAISDTLLTLIPSRFQNPLSDSFLLASVLKKFGEGLGLDSPLGELYLEF